MITEQDEGPPRVLIARLDARTGQLRWDDRFRDAGAARAGLDFGQVVQLGGSRGGAMPHAAVFVPED